MQRPPNAAPPAPVSNLMRTFHGRRRFAARALRARLTRGGVIAYATESCFGLGCDPANARAVRKILWLKGRPKAKGLLLVADDFAQLAPFCGPLTGAERARLAAHWPGPTTFVLPATRRLARAVSGRHRSLAARVSAHPDVVDLCRALGLALVSTSANRAGQRPLRTAGAVRRAFPGVRTVPGRVGKRKRPSTIVRLRGGEVLRA